MHIPVQVGKKLYPSKKSVMEEARRIRDKYVPHDGVPITDLDDVEFLFGFVKNHPLYEDKVGIGIDHFYVGRNIGTFCFWIKRIDGTVTDFSMEKCVMDEKTLRRRQQVSAFRHAVDGQTDWFKMQAFASAEQIPCPVSGKLITRADSHVDHYDPAFSVHMETFLALFGIEEVEVLPGENGRPPKIKNLEIRRQWQDYHKQHAKLRVIYWRDNLSMGSKSA